MSPVWLECWFPLDFVPFSILLRPRIDFSSWGLAVPLVQRTCCTSLRLSRPLTSLSPKCFECRSNVREEACHPGAGVVQHKRTQITQRDPTLAAHCWILVNKVVRSLLGVVPWCTLHRGMTFGSTCIAFSSSSSLVRGLPTRYVGNTLPAAQIQRCSIRYKISHRRWRKGGGWGGAWVGGEDCVDEESKEPCLRTSPTRPARLSSAGALPWCTAVIILAVVVIILSASSLGLIFSCTRNSSFGAQKQTRILRQLFKQGIQKLRILPKLHNRKVRKYLVCGGDGKGRKYLEIEDIWKTRKTEKKKGGESIWRREIAFVEEKNKEEGDKYLEKENI